MSAFAGALGVQLDKRGVYVLNAGGHEPGACVERQRMQLRRPHVLLAELASVLTVLPQVLVNVRVIDKAAAMASAVASTSSSGRSERRTTRYPRPPAMMRTPPPMSTAVRRTLMEHDWPGNVRQLRNNVERLLILATGDLNDPISADMLPQEVASTNSGGMGAERTIALPLREAREGRQTWLVGRIEVLSAEQRAGLDVTLATLRALLDDGHQTRVGTR